MSLWLSPSNDGHDIFETSENDLNIFTARKDIWRGRVPEVELVISAAQERRKYGDLAQLPFPMLITTVRRENAHLFAVQESRNKLFGPSFWSVDSCIQTPR